MKFLTSFAYKTLTALMIVMLALTATPVTPAYAASTGFTSPAACTSGGGEWSNPGNALTSNDQRATSNGDGEEMECSFNLPVLAPGSVILGIEVRVEGYASSSRDIANVDLSWNGGSSHTGGDPNIDVGGTEQVYTVGSPTNTWGRTRAVDDFTNPNFRVRLNSDNDSGDLFVDHIQVNVYYLTPTTTAVASSLNPSNPGDTVTFTATMNPIAATGTVTFQDGGVPMGPAVTLIGGVATFTISTLAGGAHNITAVYGGDATYAGSTSAVLVQGVNLAPVFITGATGSTTFTVLTAGTYSIAVSGYPLPPTMTITTPDPLPAGVTLSAAGVLSGTPATGTVGTYILNLTASNGFLPDATQNFTLTVIQRSQTITFNAPASSTFGATFTITPTASSGLPVTVTVVSGSCSIAGNVVTVTGMTNCVLAANQAGNADYSAAAEVRDTVTINKAAATVTVDPSPHTADAPSQSFYSHPMTFTVTVTSPISTPTGSITLTGGTPGQNITVPLVNGVAQITTSNLIVLYSASSGVYLAHGGNALACFLAGVNCPGLVFSYSGDANFNTDSENVSHIVYPAPTQVNVTSDINPSAAGQPVIFTVNVSTTPPGTGIPPGTVTLWDGATQLTATPIALVNGVATYSISTLAYGAHNITARFTSSSSNYASNSTSNTYVQNVRRATTTTLASNNNPSIYGENVTFTANVTSGTPGTITGTVRFYDGATLLGTSPLAGGAAAFTTSSLLVGTHPITAVYSGDGTYATSTSNVVNQVVNQATLTVRAINQSITYGDADPSPFTFTYSGFQPGDNATMIDTPPTCNVLVAHVNVGTYPITCSGGVDDYYTFNYAPPPGPPVGTLTVTRKALTITAQDQFKDFNTLFTFNGTEFFTFGLIPGDDVATVTLTSAGAPQLAAVGTYTIVPSNAVGSGGTDLNNYTITYVNGTMTVIPVAANPLIITALDQTKIYGDTFTFDETTPGMFTVTGLVGGDTVNSITLTSAGAASAADVTSYPIVPSAATGSGLGNYFIVYQSAQLVVTPRTLTFTPNDQTKIYGDVFAASNYTGAFNVGGLRVGDDITPVYDSAGAVATAPASPPTYPITVTLADPGNRLGNYNVTVNTATMTVNHRALTITANNQSKPYGTAFTFLGTEFTTIAGQLVNGDTVNTVTLTSTGALATALASPPTYPIVPSLAVGTGLGNYAITYLNGVMTVTKPDLIVIWDNQIKTYGDVFPVASFTYSITGLLNGDVITATFASAGTAATATVAGSPYSINITYNDLGGKLVNYNLVETPGTLTVQRRDVMIVADSLSKIYGDPITLTGVVTGNFLDGITFAYSSPGTALTAPVGSYAIAITLTDPNTRLGNYNYTLTPGILTVTPRPITVTSDPQSKNYGTWFFAFTGGITNLANGDAITPNFASLGSLPSAAVGTYPITVMPLNDPTGKLGNYAVTLNEGLLTVGSSTLTITADNKTISYGDPDPAFTFTYFGFASGDTPAVLTTRPTCTVSGPHTAVNTYPIVCSGGVDDAYSFTYVPAILTVQKRALVVTPADRIKTYGTAMIPADFSGLITGIQNSEAITATYDSPNGGPATATVAGSPYDITATLNAAPGVLDNYAVTLNTGRLTVIQRGLTVTPADKIKVYGDGVVFTGSINGIQNGDLITATYTSAGAAAPATVAGSPYIITATLNAPAGVLTNYSITYNQGSLTVNQRPLVVTPENKSKVFGTTFTAFTGIVTGITTFDNITVTYDSAGAINTAPVGSYDIDATLVDPDGKRPNYAVTLNTGTLTVGVNVLTVTANNQTKVYGELDPTFTFTYSGFMPGDGPGVLDTQPSCQVSVPHNNVGPFPITCSGGIDNNYIFSYVPGTLTVTSRTLVVTPANRSKLYGDALTALDFTGTLTGIQGGDNITANYASTGAAATATVAGSPYTITATLVDPGLRLGNYTVTLNTGSLTVARRPLMVTPNAASKIYGSVYVFTASSGTILGIQNGDAITATYTSTGALATATVAGSPYTITATLNAPAGVLANYTVTSNTGALTVTRRDLVVQPGDKTKEFGTVFTDFTGSIAPIQNGDNIKATYDSAGAPAAAAVGSYAITAALNDPDGRLPNYNVSISPATLTVTLTTQTITITTPAPVNRANGESFTVAATASSGLPVIYTATGVCTNVGDTFTINAPTGTCVVHYNQPGNANFGPAQERVNNVIALPNGQTITVIPPIRTIATLGEIFDVAATASSGLTVEITASGVCRYVDHGDGTATITIEAGNGTCIVHYNQAGNGSFASAPQVNQPVTIDSNHPTVTVNQVPPPAQPDPTNVSPINFTVVFSEPVTGFDDAVSDVTIAGTAAAGATATITPIAPNDGTTYNVAISGMTADGTVIVSIPADAAIDSAGNGNFASSSTDNIVTYLDDKGPTVELINTDSDTGDGVLSEGEKVTIKIKYIKVKFNQPVYDVPNDSSGPNDATNPNNYMLIHDLGDTPGFQTQSCSAGADEPADTKFPIGNVTYDSAASTYTFMVNGGLPLTANGGTYRLYVCGTTSIVDPFNTALGLEGIPGQPNSDFIRNFTINVPDGGGGEGGGGGRGGGNDSQISRALLIPVTGFAPGRVTLLPVQPADKAYKPLDEMRIEIPTLGINFPIVGVTLSKNNWNLTWLRDSVGYLEGSAYPTFSGNTVLTAHVIDANNNLGPFSDIKGMQYGDMIYIHAYGKIYIYQVQENRKLAPTNIATVFRHEEYNWVTLVTCEDYDATARLYKYRRMVRAVLISVVPEQ